MLKQYGGDLYRDICSDETNVDTLNFEKIKEVRDTYYSHTYNHPDNIENVYDTLSIGFNESLDKSKQIELRDIIEMDSKTNCCNCISISLYAKDSLPDDRLLLFTSTINKSCENVKKNLSDWIIRVYMNNIAKKKLDETTNEQIKSIWDN